jgi:hypothetical protein
VANLEGLLATNAAAFDGLYVSGQISFDEYLFIASAWAFVHSFIHKDQKTDLDIMQGLNRQELREAFTGRIFDSSRSEYTRAWILDTARSRPELIKWLYRLFDRKFNPAYKTRMSASKLEQEIAQNAWLTVMADADVLFETPAEARLPAAMRLLGIDFSRLSDAVGHA